MMKSKILLVVSYIAVGLFLLSGCMKNEETEGTKKIRDAYADRIAAQTAKERADAALVDANTSYKDAETAWKLADAAYRKAQADFETRTLEAKISEQLETYKANLINAQALTVAAQQALMQANKDYADAKYLNDFIGDQDGRKDAYDFIYNLLFGGGGLYNDKFNTISSLHGAQVAFLNAQIEDVASLKVGYEIKKDQAASDLKVGLKLLADCDNLLAKTQEELKQALGEYEQKVKAQESAVNAFKESIRDINYEIAKADVALKPSYEKLGEGLDIPGADAALYKYAEKTILDPTVVVDIAKTEWEVTGYDKTASGLKTAVDFLDKRIKFLKEGEASTVVGAVPLDNGYGNIIHAGVDAPVQVPDEIGGLVWKTTHWVSIPYLDKTIEANEAQIKSNQIYLETVLKGNVNDTKATLEKDYGDFIAAETAYEAGRAALDAVNAALKGTKILAFIESDEVTFPASGKPNLTTGELSALRTALINFFASHYTFDGYSISYYDAVEDKTIKCTTAALLGTYFATPVVATDLYARIAGAFNFGAGSLEDRIKASYNFTTGNNYTFKDADGSISTVTRSSNGILESYTSAGDDYDKSIWGKLLISARKAVGANKLSDLAFITAFYGKTVKEAVDYPGKANDPDGATILSDYNHSSHFAYKDAEKQFNQNEEVTKKLIDKKDSQKAILAVCNKAVTDFGTQKTALSTELKTLQDAMGVLLDAKTALETKKRGIMVDQKAANDEWTYLKDIYGFMKVGDVDLLETYYGTLLNNVYDDKTGYVVKYNEANKDLEIFNNTNSADIRKYLIDKEEVRVKQYEFQLENITKRIDELEEQMKTLFK